MADRPTKDNRMDEQTTIEELEHRYEKTLQATLLAASDHPRAYRRLKAQAATIINTPIDINDYLPTVDRLTHELHRLDCRGHDSIFHIFSARVAPSSVWQVGMLRMECKDLLAHLYAFDEWRRRRHRLVLVK